MLPTISFDERRQVEQLITGAFSSFTGDLQGRYFPLNGSESCAKYPGGIGADEKLELMKHELLFEESKSPSTFIGGINRGWPDARGVFLSHKRQFAAWVNEEDQLKLISFSCNRDIQSTFRCLCLAEACIKSYCRTQKYDFAWDDRLGFLSTCPSGLGTCLQVEIRLHIPFLSKNSNFRPLCKQLHLKPRSVNKIGTWTISNRERLGSSEANQVTSVMKAAQRFVELERQLSSGNHVNFGISELEQANAVDDAWELPSNLPICQPVISDNESGSEDEASSKERSNEKEREMLRTNIMSVLVKAYEDGRLQEIITEAVPGRQVEGRDTDAYRQHMHTLLISAEKDGSLAKLLQQHSKP